MIASECSYAGFLVGNDLSKGMMEFNKFETGGEYNSSDFNSYMSYTLGVADSTYNILWCPESSKINTAQVAKIVSKYLNNNPEKLHRDASSLVINALMQAFPCENHSKRSQKR